MEIFELTKLVQDIVTEANELKNKHIDYPHIPVNYACVFAQNDREYLQMDKTAAIMGKVIKETNSGKLYQIKPLDTVAGKLQILKIRKPDQTKAEKGDADFTIADFESFKSKYLLKPGYKLIPKDGFVMIELMDPEFDVRVYFSNPPLDKQFGLV